MKENWLDNEWDDAFEDDTWLDPFREALSRDEGNIYIPIPGEVEKVRRVYRAMKELTADYDVAVTCKLFQPFLFCASVTLEGSELIFDDVAVFADVAQLADNFEVYPLVNGNVRLSFAFNHLVTKVGRIGEG